MKSDSASQAEGWQSSGPEHQCGPARDEADGPSDATFPPWNGDERFRSAFCLNVDESSVAFDRRAVISPGAIPRVVVFKEWNPGILGRINQCVPINSATAGSRL